MGGWVGVINVDCFASICPGKEERNEMKEERKRRKERKKKGRKERKKERE